MPIDPNLVLKNAPRSYVREALDGLDRGNERNRKTYDFQTLTKKNRWADEDRKKADNLDATLKDVFSRNDPNTPEGQTTGLHELSQRGYGVEAMDIAEKFQKANAWADLPTEGGDLYEKNSRTGEVRPTQFNGQQLRKYVAPLKPTTPQFEVGADDRKKMFDPVSQTWVDTGLKVRPQPQTLPNFTGVVTGTPGDERTVFVNNRDPSKVVDPNLPKAAKLSPLAKTTISKNAAQLKIFDAQLENLQKAATAIKGSFASGPFGQGKIPTSAGKSFDQAKAALALTVRGLTRTPGEGSFSDMETRLQQAALPDRNNYEEVTQQGIDQLKQMSTLLKESYAQNVANGTGLPTANPESGETVKWGRDANGKPVRLP